MRTRMTAIKPMEGLNHPLPVDYPFLADTYSTPPEMGHPVKKWLPTLFFYKEMLKIVFQSAKLAKAGVFTSDLWTDASLKIVRALEEVGGRFEIEGTDHFKTIEGPCVFIGNHMSTLETFVLPCLIEPMREVTFVVKHQLVAMPVFGHIMRSRNPVVVGRTNPREDLAAVLEEGSARLRDNISVVVFPQSTRSLRLDPKLFNTIGVKLAKKAGVPVVPVALKTNAWGMGLFVKDFGRIVPKQTVHFRFGEPMTITDNGKQQHMEIYSFIQNSLEEWEKKDEWEETNQE